MADAAADGRAELGRDARRQGEGGDPPGLGHEDLWRVGFGRAGAFGRRGGQEREEKLGDLWRASVGGNDGVSPQESEAHARPESDTTHESFSRNRSLRG